MNLLKEKRKQMGMTQKEFAKVLDIPAHRVSRMENGYMEIEDACAFCNAFPKEFEIKSLRVQKKGRIIGDEPTKR